MLVSGRVSVLISKKFPRSVGFVPAEGWCFQQLNFNFSMGSTSVLSACIDINTNMKLYVLYIYIYMFVVLFTNSIVTSRDIFPQRYLSTGEIPLFVSGKS